MGALLDLSSLIISPFGLSAACKLWTERKGCLTWRTWHRHWQGDERDLYLAAFKLLPNESIGIEDMKIDEINKIKRC